MIGKLIRNWMALTIGTMIGVAVMWLIAPMTGEETRRILSGNLADVQNKANAVLEEAQGKVREIGDISRRVIDDQKAVIEKGVEEVKSTAKRS